MAKLDEMQESISIGELIMVGGLEPENLRVKLCLIKIDRIINQTIAFSDKDKVRSFMDIAELIRQLKIK